MPGPGETREGTCWCILRPSFLFPKHIHPLSLSLVLPHLPHPQTHTLPPYTQSLDSKEVPNLSLGERF